MNSGNVVKIMFIDMPGSIDGLRLARRRHRIWPEVKLVAHPPPHMAGPSTFR
jgi:hypothetical protein